ncbi:tetratricopeptide repeat protein [bacterium]|nr:tetratricopeptide repeat protein [bacterium]
MKKLLTIAILCIGIPVFAESLYDPSNDAKLEYNQGIDYYKSGQYDRSMAAFRRAIELDANYVDAYYNLGSILEYLKQYEAALDIFKQIIVRKPDDYEALYKAANISYKLGNKESAQKYLSLIPPNSEAFSSAQNLAKMMGADINTIKPETSNYAEKEKSEETNKMIYNNLPSPTGIAGDNFGNIYVACFSDNMIYKITPDGKQMIFIKDSKINGPIAMVSDTRDNLYISNYNGDNVIKVTPTGTITTLLSNVSKPYGMSIINGILYVSSQGSNAVLKYKL